MLTPTGGKSNEQEIKENYSCDLNSRNRSCLPTEVVEYEQTDSNTFHGRSRKNSPKYKLKIHNGT